MKGDSSKLSHKQLEAIAALLSQRSVEEAARVARVGARTLHRWLKDTEFQKAYQEAVRAAFRQSISRLHQMTGPAVATLGRIMADPASPAASRVRASHYILEHATEALEIEQLKSRLSELECVDHASRRNSK